MRKCVIRLHVSRLGPGQMTERWPAGRPEGGLALPGQAPPDSGVEEGQGRACPFSGGRLST